jgi:hypothetical protein
LTLTGALDLSIGFPQLGLQGTGVHTGHDLSGLNGLTFIGEHVRKTAREFGGHIDFLHLKPTIPAAKPHERRRSNQKPPDGYPTCNEQNHDSGNYEWRNL